MLVENKFLDALMKVRGRGRSAVGLFQTILAIYMIKLQTGLSEKELTAEQVSLMTGIGVKRQGRLLEKALELDLVKCYPTKEHPELPKQMGKK